jgi:hypothetical protein
MSATRPYRNIAGDHLSRTYTTLRDSILGDDSLDQLAWFEVRFWPRSSENMTVAASETTERMTFGLLS